MIKFGTDVIIVKDAFFTGATGKLINYKYTDEFHPTDNRMKVLYLVLLAGDQKVWFNEHAIEATK